MSVRYPIQWESFRFIFGTTLPKEPYVHPLLRPPYVRAKP